MRSMRNQIQVDDVILYILYHKVNKQYVIHHASCRNSSFDVHLAISY